MPTRGKGNHLSHSQAVVVFQCSHSWEIVTNLCIHGQLLSSKVGCLRLTTSTFTSMLQAGQWQHLRFTVDSCGVFPFTVRNSVLNPHLLSFPCFTMHLVPPVLAAAQPGSLKPQPCPPSLHSYQFIYVSLLALMFP